MEAITDSLFAFPRKSHCLLACDEVSDEVSVSTGNFPSRRNFHGENCGRRKKKSLRSMNFLVSIAGHGRVVFPGSIQSAQELSLLNFQFERRISSQMR